MIPVNQPPVTEESEVEALLAFDRAPAAENDPSASAVDASFVEGVDECQRLLEAVWPRSALPAFEVPRQFARFSIVRELGRGGFGVVFLALDSVLGRQVALKVPRPEVLVTPEFRRRFLREAEAASRLDHPHIVPVYEVGEEGPICYIASAYCEGLTLAEWLRRQTSPVPIVTAARLVAVLAGAVAHAHQRGILHRDLKPGNILLRRLDGSQSASEAKCHGLGFFPRICDFGLAKLLDQESHETCSGVAIGSSRYMAPEQAAGRLREHGPATDVYALGVILYELLTGRPPLRGETDLETLRLVSDQDPPRPRDLRPGLPRDLETITLKCLEKRPKGRYATAAELTEDLQRFLDGKPVHARPVPAWARAGKWARRRPVHATLAVVLGNVLLAVPAGLEWTRAREKQYSDVIRVALDRSRRGEEEARDLSVLAHRHWAANQLRLAGSLSERGQTEPARLILDTLGPSQSLPDSRGFAWYYLDRICRPRVEMLAPLPDMVVAVAHSADGRTIALADAANTTFLLNRDTGQLRALSGKHRHRGRQYLVFSPDGRSLASMSHDISRPEWCKSEVRLWDIVSGEELKGMGQNFGFCYQLLFSPDGGTLVTVEASLSHQEAPVRSWRLSDDRKRVTLGELLRADQVAASLAPAHRTGDSGREPFRLSDALTVIAGDVPTMAVSLEGGEIRLYTTDGGYCRAVCRALGPEAVFVPRTDLTVPCTKAEVNEIGRLACALTGRAHARPIRQGVPVLWAQFSRDGRTAAVFERYPGRPHGTLRLIDVGTGRVDVEPPWEDVPAGCAFGFTPAGDALVVTAFDTRARLMHVNDWRAPGMLRGHMKEVWGLVFSPDGKSLASAADDHTIKRWDVASGRERDTLAGHGALVTAVASSPDGSLLASASFDKTIRLWDAASGDQIATLEGDTDRVRTVAFSPDGNTLASAGDDLEIRLWDVAKRSALSPPLTGHTERVFAVAFAPDGKTLFSGARDKTIRSWDWSADQARAVWRAEDQVYALAVSPDGQTLAVAHPGGKVTLWDVAQAKARPPLRGHVGDVLGIAFSPDGLTLASAGRDQTVRLWDPVTGQELLTLKGHEAPVHAVSFSPDGTILATGSHDGVIKLWRASKSPNKHEILNPKS